MLRSLIFLSTIVVGSLALARGSAMKNCINSLQYYYLAPYSQAMNICSQNSTNEFVSCMENKAETTNLDITEVMPLCSRKIQTAPRFGTCEARLQIDARMSYDLSLRTCAWDSSQTMQSCIVDLAQQAKFHPQHALQYCAFAKSQYLHEINYFKTCVISNTRKGYDVFSNVQNCHDRITGVYVEPVLPPVEDRRPKPITPNNQVFNNPQSERQQQPPSDAQESPQPQVPPQTESVPAKPAPQKQTGTVTKVPVPVEIKVQESSKPEVQDQPIESQSTSNAESLPL